MLLFTGANSFAVVVVVDVVAAAIPSSQLH